MTLDPQAYSPLPAFSATCGPKDAKVVFVGEAWGENEDKIHSPFVGWSGFELSRMIAEAGLAKEPPLKPEQFSSMMLRDWWDRQGILLTNVFAFRPADNKLTQICGKKKDVGKDYKHDKIGQEGYVLPRFLAELERLRDELCFAERTCVVAFGAKAAWALLGSAKIGAIRGVAASSTLVRGLKILPTYHPAGIMRNWSWRAIAIADLIKVANREQHFAEVRRPERTILRDPTVADIRAWLNVPARAYAIDTETVNRQIEMIGLARSRSEALVIRLVNKSRLGFSHWSESDEQEIWRLLRWRLEDPSIVKIFQNGLYDLQYFIRRSPLRPRNCSEDSMLLSHSLFPELPKGLGFLGSIHTNEASWKLWRGKEQEEFKRDE